MLVHRREWGLRPCDGKRENGVTQVLKTLVWQAEDAF